jgi:hypothetical protein
MARQPTGPGPVAMVHRILIATALVGAIVFAAWEVREYLRDRRVGAAVGATIAFGVAGGIAAYLRSLRNLGAKLSPRRDVR